MTAILRITDGTTTVDLLKARGRTGFHLTNWRQQTAQFKDDGVWQDSPLSDGRQLADYQYANVIETFEVALDGHDQDGLARETQNLQRLLVQAANYWKAGWSCLPVYLEARAACETNTRYALLYKGSIPELDNTYAQPFLSRHTTMRDLTVVVERAPFWTETAPGIGTAVAVSNPGRTATTASGEVFVANKHNTAQLTHIYTKTAGGVWSANFVASTAFGLLPANVNNGDEVYFGVSPARPFCSLVFDIGTVMAGITGTAWTTHGGAIGANTWNALTTQDNTNADGAMTGWAFDTAGVKSVHWTAPATWTSGNLQTIFAGTAPNVAAMWVRLAVVSAGAGTTPTQQNRIVYTVLWPYVETAAAQVPGDVTALLKATIRNENANQGAGADNDSLMALWLGLRSMSRGTNFTPFINLADEQNPAGLTVSLLAYGGGAAAFADVLDTPSGRAVLLNGAAPGDGAFVYADFGSALLTEYYGRYHVFVRTLNVDATALTAQLAVYFGNTQIALTQAFTLSIDTNYVMTDMGTVTIPPSVIASDETPFVLRLRLDVASDGDVNVCELILLPVDEWSASVSVPPGDLGDLNAAYRIVTAGGTFVSPTSFMVDAIGYPKAPQRALGVTGAEIHATLNMVPNGRPMLQANAQQRLWMLQAYQKDMDATEPLQSYPHVAGSVAAERQARYLGLRGKR